MESIKLPPKTVACVGIPAPHPKHCCPGHIGIPPSILALNFAALEVNQSRLSHRLSNVSHYGEES